MPENEVVYAQQRWEYLSFFKRTETALENELNTLGQSGWELVSFHCGKDRKGEMAWTAFGKAPGVGATSHGSRRRIRGTSERAGLAGSGRTGNARQP